MHSKEKGARTRPRTLVSNTESVGKFRHACYHLIDYYPLPQGSTGAEYYTSGAGTSISGCGCCRNNIVLVSSSYTLPIFTSCQFCLGLGAQGISLSSHTLPLFLFFLLFNFQELQAEVNAHKQQVQRVLDKGKTMVVGQHPSAQKISEKCQELVAAWQGLEKACEERMKQLQHSVGFQEVQINSKVVTQ